MFFFFFLIKMRVLVHIAHGAGLAMQVKDYDAALDLELDSMEKFVLQCLAFYQVSSCQYDMFPVSV